MIDYEAWAARHPHAARDLLALHRGAMALPGEAKTSEARAQQVTRASISRQGAMSWRNNVGATPAKCEQCGAMTRPVRYGLANESMAQNKVIKSADLILAIPRVITPLMVGTTIAQFGSVECKPPGWKLTGKGREGGQVAWASLMTKLGAFAAFSTGEVQL
jgi:hypothetical protein